MTPSHSKRDRLSPVFALVKENGPLGMDDQKIVTVTNWVDDLFLNYMVY